MCASIKHHDQDDAQPRPVGAEGAARAKRARAQVDRRARLPAPGPRAARERPADATLLLGQPRPRQAGGRPRGQGGAARRARPVSATVDANVLVYASNESESVHQPARKLLERLAAGPEIVYLFWPAIMGYLRIV